MSTKNLDAHCCRAVLQRCNAVCGWALPVIVDVQSDPSAVKVPAYLVPGSTRNAHELNGAMMS